MARTGSNTAGTGDTSLVAATNNSTGATAAAAPGAASVPGAQAFDQVAIGLADVGDASKALGLATGGTVAAGTGNGLVGEVPSESVVSAAEAAALQATGPDEHHGKGGLYFRPKAGGPRTLVHRSKTAEEAQLAAKAGQAVAE